MTPADPRAAAMEDMRRCTCGHWRDKHDDKRDRCAGSNCRCTGFVSCGFIVVVEEVYRQGQAALLALPVAEPPSDRAARERVEPVTHVLKTWPAFFAPLASGRKTFEVRKNDRDFRERDRLVLREWDEARGFTGAQVEATISYVLVGGQFGIGADFVVLGLGPALPVAETGWQWQEARYAPSDHSMLLLYAPTNQRGRIDWGFRDFTTGKFMVSSALEHWTPIEEYGGVVTHFIKVRDIPAPPEPPEGAQK